MENMLLKTAVTVFRENRTKKNYLNVVEHLMKSSVWIPCTVVFGNLDQKIWEEIAREAQSDPASVVGKEMTIQEDIRLVPDILQNGDSLFFPVFSDPIEMGEYGNRFSRIRKPFPEAVRMVQAGGNDLSGIVLNAFSEPFILNRELIVRMEGQ